MPEYLNTKDMDQLVIEFVDAVNTAAETRGYMAGKAATKSLAALCLGHIPDSVLVECAAEIKTPPPSPRRFLSYFNRRRAPLATAAVLIICLLSLGGEAVIGHNTQNAPKVGETQSGYDVYRDPHTGRQAGGDAARETIVASEVLWQSTDSIVGWVAGGGSAFTRLFTIPGDSLFYSETIDGPDMIITNELLQFLSDEGPEIETRARNGLIKQTGTVKRTIDGSSLEFREYVTKSKAGAAVNLLIWEPSAANISGDAERKR